MLGYKQLWSWDAGCILLSLFAARPRINSYPPIAATIGSTMQYVATSNHLFSQSCVYLWVVLSVLLCDMLCNCKGVRNYSHPLSAFRPYAIRLVMCSPGSFPSKGGAAAVEVARPDTGRASVRKLRRTQLPRFPPSENYANRKCGKLLL